MAEFQLGHIGKIDAKTGKVMWHDLPTPNARARRMTIDDQDRILVTEFRGNKVALFDTNTEKMTEWPMPARQERRDMGQHNAHGGSIPRPARPSNICCRRKPTCAASSSTIRHRPSASGQAAHSAPASTFLLCASSRRHGPSFSTSPIGFVLQKSGSLFRFRSRINPPQPTGVALSHRDSARRSGRSPLTSSGRSDLLARR
jgi:hypothetical protein